MKIRQIKINSKFQFFSLLIIIMSIMSCESEDFSAIYNEPGYAIGTITHYKEVPFKITYFYDFTIDGKEYTGEDVAKGIGEAESRLIGKKFLVVYKLSNISENTINYNYPINSETEFEELVESFKTNPPKQY